MKEAHLAGCKGNGQNKWKTEGLVIWHILCVSQSYGKEGIQAIKLLHRAA
jgi:hypothetical protein